MSVFRQRFPLNFVTTSREVGVGNRKHFGAALWSEFQFALWLACFYQNDRREARLVFKLYLDGGR